jgi:hypothetical protein
LARLDAGLASNRERDIEQEFYPEQVMMPPLDDKDKAFLEGVVADIDAARDAVARFADEKPSHPASQTLRALSE